MQVFSQAVRFNQSHVSILLGALWEDLPTTLPNFVELVVKLVQVASALQVVESSYVLSLRTSIFLP